MAQEPLFTFPDSRKPRIASSPRRFMPTGRRGAAMGVRARLLWPVTVTLGQLAPGMDSECWIRSGAGAGGVDNRDYSVMTHNGRNVTAHRVAYELWFGPIPDGLTIDHLCRVKRCVNPDHLQPVSRTENTRRAMRVWAAVAPEGRP